MTDENESPGFACADKKAEPSIELVDQLSYVKQGTDDEDLCQIDKITTERSQQSTRQKRRNDQAGHENEPQITGRDGSGLESGAPKDHQPYQANQERLLNLNRVLTAE